MSATSWLPPLQEHAQLWGRIESAINSQRMPQALLLLGPRHVGISSFATRLAAILLCHESNKPCGLCDACHLLQAATHPDFRKIFPDTEGGVIKIDQIRALQEEVYQTPQCGQSTVILIEPADKLNGASANALLKILEEPPQQVYFVLVAEQKSTLPATILSRCQQMVFPDIGLDASHYFALGEHYPIVAPRAKLMAKRQSIIESLCDIIEGKVSVCSIALLWKNEDLVDLMWLLYLISAQAVQMHLSHTPSIKSDATDALTRLASLLSPIDLLKHLDALNPILKKLSHNISINPTLALESLLIAYARKSHGR